MQIPCAQTMSFSLYLLPGFRQTLPFNQVQCFKTLMQQCKKKSLYMAINFQTTDFCPNFSPKQGFFSPHHLNFFLSYTLPILRFGAQMYLNLSAS